MTVSSHTPSINRICSSPHQHDCVEASRNPALPIRQDQVDVLPRLKVMPVKASDCTPLIDRRQADERRHVAYVILPVNPQVSSTSISLHYRSNSVGSRTSHTLAFSLPIHQRKGEASQCLQSLDHLNLQGAKAIPQAKAPHTLAQCACRMSGPFSR